jgi:hypothetical protein
MRSPEDFPADILKEATAAYEAMPLCYDGWDEDAVIACIARALMERDRAATERAAKIAEGFDAWPQEGADIAAAIRSQL